MAAVPPVACSDKVNHPVLIANGTPCQASRRDCVEAANHGGMAFSVCDTCSADTAGSVSVQGLIGRLPRLAKPQLPAPTAQARSLGFRTLVCEACANREIQLRQARYDGIAPLEYTMGWSDRRFMEQYSRNTCTCRQRLQRMDRPRRRSHRHCWTCRMNLCNEIETNRNNNEAWLEDIARDATWNTISTRVTTRRRRNREGTFRACRCGNTVEAKFGEQPPGNPPTQRAEVSQCLSCEGIAHASAGIIANVKDFNPRKHLRNFTLGRARGTRKG